MPKVRPMLIAGNSFQLAQQVPALKSDGSDGGVIVPDFDLTPAFYNGLPRFAVRPSPLTQ